ncbi:MAG: hypothetical protein JRJ51_08720 [Deltaproteobacteria bacterium]|nr:hypothetical protein [Deltaproteobacteria bacterium]
METIDQTLRKVDMAEQEHLRKVDMAEQEHLDGTLAQKKRLDEGMALAKAMIEEERFEEALQELEKLEKETRTLREVATEKFINQERNRAARLYLMARNTTDPEKKEALLLSSYKKLKALIDKYPSSSLNSRLNNNLIKVREELHKMGVNPG